MSITGLYAGLLALLLLGLSYRISALRRKHAVMLGDGGREDLARAIRVQGNLLEYVPLALLLMLALELGQTSAWLVHALGVALTAGRILHAQGLSSRPGRSFGRLAGTALTWLALLVAALAAIARSGGLWL